MKRKERDSNAKGYIDNSLKIAWNPKLPYLFCYQMSMTYKTIFTLMLVHLSDAFIQSDTLKKILNVICHIEDKFIAYVSYLG